MRCAQRQVFKNTRLYVDIVPQFGRIARSVGFNRKGAKVKLAIRIILLLAGVGLAVAVAREYLRREEHLNDQLSRINTTNYMLLDLSMRNYHHQAHKDHKNPWCPECYDLLHRYKHHVEDTLTDDNLFRKSESPAGE